MKAVHLYMTEVEHASIALVGRKCNDKVAAKKRTEMQL